MQLCLSGARTILRTGGSVLFNSNNFASSAALPEVCALLNVILAVYVYFICACGCGLSTVHYFIFRSVRKGARRSCPQWLRDSPQLTIL